MPTVDTWIASVIFVACGLERLSVSIIRLAHAPRKIYTDPHQPLRAACWLTIAVPAAKIASNHSSNAPDRDAGWNMDETFTKCKRRGQ